MTNAEFATSGRALCPGGSLSQQQQIFASNGTISDYFGHSLDVEGDLAVVAAPFDDPKSSQSGRAYILERSATIWKETGSLISPNPCQLCYFGWGQEIVGSQLLIAAWGDKSPGPSSAGAVYVYGRSGTGWSQQARLTANDGAMGDKLGYSVSLRGDTALVGAYLDDDRGVNSGSAYLFVRSGSSWSQKQKLTASTGSPGAYFGHSVGLSKYGALIGATRDDKYAGGGTDSGAVYSWKEVCLSLDAGPPPDLPQPDLPQPDLLQPDLLVPDMLVPDMLVPDMPGPDGPAPDSASPDLPRPDVTPPAADLPGRDHAFGEPVPLTGLEGAGQGAADSDTGCDCRVSGGPPSPLLLLLAVCFLRRRRAP